MNLCLGVSFRWPGGERPGGPVWGGFTVVLQAPELQRALDGNDRLRPFGLDTP